MMVNAQWRCARMQAVTGSRIDLLHESGLGSCEKLWSYSGENPTSQKPEITPPGHHQPVDACTSGAFRRAIEKDCAQQRPGESNMGGERESGQSFLMVNV